MKRARETVLILGVALFVCAAAMFDYRWGLLAVGWLASIAALIGLVKHD